MSVKKEHLCLLEVCVGNMEGGSFTGEPKEYVKEGTGNRHLSPQGPLWGTWRGFIYQGL